MRLILILLIAFAVGFSYSFIINKIFRNKFILFLPSMAGIGWIVYTMVTYNPNNYEGFDDIALLIMGILIFAVMVGNVIGAIVFIVKGNKTI